MKKIRILSALMALLLVISLLAACNKNETKKDTNKPTGTTAADPTGTEPSTEDPGCDDDVTNPVEDPADPEGSEPTDPSGPESGDPTEPTTDPTEPEGSDPTEPSTTPENPENPSEPEGGNQGGNQGGSQGGNQGGTESTDPEEPTYTISFVNNATELTIKVAEGKYTLYNGTAPVKDVTFVSEDKTVCTFEDGVITPIDSGRTTVKATYNGTTLECKIRVMSNNEIDFDDLVNAGK